MPRIRTLKPEHRTHRKIGPLSDRAYRLWVGMICEADDHGRLILDAEYLRVVVFGYHPKVTVKMIDEAISEIERTGLIRTYTGAAADSGTFRNIPESSGTLANVPPGVKNTKKADVQCTRYAEFPSWHDHQRVSHPSHSQLPEYQAFGNIPEHSGTFQNVPQGSDRIGSDRKGSNTAHAALVETAARDSLAAAEPAARDEPKISSLDNPKPSALTIPQPIMTALDRSPRLGAVKQLRNPAFWLAEIRANSTLDFPRLILKAEAWLVSNQHRRFRNLPRFLHNWFANEPDARDEKS